MFKKILLFILLFTIYIIPVNAEETIVNVYVFTKDDCSSCKKAINYFKELLNSEDYTFNLREIRVWNDSWLSYSDDLYNLIDEVYTYFDYDLASIGGVPTIVIGDFFYNGYPTDTSILSEAIDKYNDIDVVEEVVVSLEIDIEDIIYEGDDEEDSDTYIPDTLTFAIIFIIVIVGIGILVIMSKKQ